MQAGADGGVGAALRHQRQHLALAVGEAIDRVGAVRQQAGDDLGVEDGAAGGDLPDRGEEAVDVRDAVLEQVADGALAVGEQVARVDRLDVLAEDENGQRRAGGRSRCWPRSSRSSS
nr:hypothetical protein [Jiangella muralis]